jgi:hypothetical protein
MFSKSITNSSQFLMMPQSSQNLYFHLGMNADDDGFCEHFGIMRMTDSKPDDLKVLQAKSFVQIFDDKVLVITHWKENNYLRSDRYTPSKYLEIYKNEIKQLANSGIPDDNQMATQDRIGKDRIGKSKDNIAVKPQVVEKKKKNENNPVSLIVDFFYKVNNWPLPVSPAEQKLYRRWLRPAKELFELCEGNIDEAKTCIKKVGEWAVSRKLSWGIETIFKKWYDLDFLKPKEKKPYYDGKRIFQKSDGGRYYVVSRDGDIKELGISPKKEEIIWK